MSILDNEGHDPRGFGNNPTYIETRDKIAAAREKQFAEARAEIARLRAMQASLIEALTNLLAQNKGPEWVWARLVLNEAIAMRDRR